MIKSENIENVYRYSEVYRVLDHVYLRLTTFRENFLSSSGKVEDVVSIPKDIKNKTTCIIA